MKMTKLLMALFSCLLFTTACSTAPKETGNDSSTKQNETGASDQETDNGLEPGNVYTIEGNKSPYEKYLNEDSLSIEEICEEVDEENMANAIYMKTGNVEEFLKDWFIRNGYGLITSDIGEDNDGSIIVGASGSFEAESQLGVRICSSNPDELQLSFVKIDLNDITNGETTKVTMSQIPAPEQTGQIFSVIYGE